MGCVGDLPASLETAIPSVPTTPCSRIQQMLYTDQVGARARRTPPREVRAGPVRVLPFFYRFVCSDLFFSFLEIVRFKKYLNLKKNQIYNVRI
jgi:hypothetical protein